MVDLTPSPLHALTPYLFSEQCYVATYLKETVRDLKKHVIKIIFPKEAAILKDRCDLDYLMFKFS